MDKYKILFVRYSDMLKNGLGEKDQAHLIYSYFVKFNKTVSIDVEKFLYNINGYYLDKISTQEDLDTKHFYSPIPLSVLLKVAKELNISINKNMDSRELKKNIVDHLVAHKYTKQKLISSISDVKIIEIINNLFKPYCKSKIVMFNDFTQHYNRNNDLETFQSKKDNNRYGDIWLSNKSLLAFIRPFIENSDFHYIGVIHLKDFDHIKYEQLNDLYNRHRLKPKLLSVIKNNKQRYIVALVSSNDHWSALCYDSHKKFLYYFNSKTNSTGL